MGEKFKLPSGVELDVTPLPYEEAWAITTDVVKVLGTLNVDIAGMDLKALAATDVLKFKGPICQILSSPDCLKSVKQCFSRCKYGENRIDATTFESKQARGDYLFAAFYAVKENVSPFFETVLSFFGNQ